MHPLQPPLIAAAARFSAIPDDRTVLIDGLAFGALPELIEQHGCRLRFVPIIHMPLSHTPGLLPGERGWLANLERRALDYARHVVITGPRTRPMLQSRSGQLRPEQITCIPPGTDRPRPAGDESSRPSGIPLRILCVANLTPGKGHDVLLRALSRAPRRDWVLVCAGSLTRDLAWAGHIAVLARDLGIDDRVTLAGELDDRDLESEYCAADLVALATRGETYGMAVAEAIAHGLPVVSTATGDIESIAGDGALLAVPEDDDGFARQLALAMEHPDVRRQLADGARAAALRLPTWNDAVTQMIRVLDTVQG
jgi:glycosyltransferase involved in cell wall biosynthesis